MVLIARTEACARGVSNAVQIINISDDDYAYVIRRRACPRRRLPVRTRQSPKSTGVVAVWATGWSENEYRGRCTLTDSISDHSEIRPSGRRRIAPGPLLPGVVLTVVGLAFLLDNLDLVDSWTILRFWPVILLVVGLRNLAGARDPAMGYLQADIRGRWLRIPQGVPSSYRYTDFTKKVTGALHRAGVSLMAGTDAMGFPLVTPGSSLHRELQLLVESGLTPYEALRAATVAPAGFLGREGEFGTIAVGKRADLLLVEDNPLENIGHLRTPVGVMARGKWFGRRQLEQMLDGLRPPQRPAP